jgi:hypothetical protein
VRERERRSERKRGERREREGGGPRGARGAFSSCPPTLSLSAVCLENEAAFEKEKGLVLKEYNHAKTSGKLTWKADKAGEFYFVDPDRCGAGMLLTVSVVDPVAKAGRRLLAATA